MKNGSKHWLRISSDIPIPVSVTSITIKGVSVLVFSVNVPPLGIASTALKTRFVSISRNWDSLPNTFPVLSSRVTMLMDTFFAAISSFHNGRVMPTVDSMSFATSTGFRSVFLAGA